MAQILSMLAALALASSQACAAQKAFVIGISNYENVETVVNPTIDATKIADKLAESGYSVTRIIDGGTGNSELDDLVEALAKSRTPTSKNNSVYLGKTAAANCEPGTSGNAFPFGCELIKKITAMSGGDSDVFVPPVRLIKAGVEVKIRKTLPSNIGFQLTYECRVGVLMPGQRITIAAVVRYNLAEDSYFFGAVAGKPKSECLPDRLPLYQLSPSK